MEWSSIDWNSTIPEVFEALLDKWSDQSGQLSKFLFDNCVLPVGQYLLSSAERAVQYTLNGEYEVTRGERQIKCHRLIFSRYYDFSWVKFGRWFLLFASLGCWDLEGKSKNLWKFCGASLQVFIINYYFILPGRARSDINFSQSDTFLAGSLTFSGEAVRLELQGNNTNFLFRSNYCESSV